MIVLVFSVGLIARVFLHLLSLSALWMKYILSIRSGFVT